MVYIYPLQLSLQEYFRIWDITINLYDVFRR